MSSPKSPPDPSVERANHARRAKLAACLPRVERAGRNERVERRQRAGRSDHVDATAFLYAIIDAGDRVREARAFDGSIALPLDKRSRLLRAIERCGGAPSFADLARLLQVSPPSARNRALAAASAGVVELLPCPEDRRLIQVALTPAGRRLLEGQRMPPIDWVFTLLNGLPRATMASCSHVLCVLVARLERYEKEMRRARRGGPGAY